MTSTTCKLHNSQSSTTQCFRAGKRHRQSRNGASHWLEAYRNSEEQRYRNMQREMKKKKKKAETPDSLTLDGLLLLQFHCVDQPSDLCSVDVSERNITAVKSEDFHMFDSVTSIDASVNSLCLDSFSSFVSLRKLNLALNGIHNVSFNADDFHHLKVLDLSFNRVSPEDVLALGRLPVLRVLHLTGNELHHLPPDLTSFNHDLTSFNHDLTSSNHDLTSSKHDLTSSNHDLTSSNHDLTNVSSEENHSLFKSLEELMLDDNKLSHDVFYSLKRLKRLRYIDLSMNMICKVPCMQLMENESCDIKTLTQILQQENWDQFSKENTLPLAGLHFLNLSNNKILTEEMLMGAALFPRLREVNVHLNPVATKRRVATPLLSHLQDKLRITIRTEDESMHSTWKAEEEINPKMWTKVGCGDANVLKKTQDMKSKADPVFITETEDEFPMATNNTALMDVQHIPDALESAETQTLLWMLKHKLDNLHVYRDSKPKLDGIQTVFTHTQKRIKDLPPFKRIQHPTERLDEMMEVIRGSRTVTVAALDRILHSSSITNREEHKEAVLLMRDVKKKYKKLHQNVLERTTGSDIINEHEEQTGGGIRIGS